jgi:hypothetical protein
MARPSHYKVVVSNLKETHFALVDEAAHVALFDEGRTIRILNWLHERRRRMVREIHAERQAEHPDDEEHI